MLTLLLVGAVQWQQYDRAARRVATAELACQPIRDMRAQNSRMQQEIDAIRSRDSVLLALGHQRSLVSLIGWTSRSMRDRAGTVYLEQFEFQQDPLATDLNESSSAMLALAGTGRDPETIRQLVAVLRRDGPFRNVEVQMQHVPQSSESDCQQFSIECNP
jgi:hypothetical protein